MECAWFQDKPFEWFSGCNDYQTLVLHPEVSYKEKKMGIFQASDNKKRTLYKDFFYGLDNLKQLVINRPCIIETGAFANLKNIENVEIIWKKNPVVLKDNGAVPNSGDIPVLYQQSLADIPLKAKLQAKKGILALIDNKKLALKCSFLQLSRDLSLNRDSFYRDLKEHNRQVSFSPQKSPMHRNASHASPGFGSQDFGNIPTIDRRPNNVPVELRRSQSHIYRVYPSESPGSRDETSSEFGSSRSQTIDFTHRDPDLVSDPKSRNLRRSLSIDASSVALHDSIPLASQDDDEYLPAAVTEGKAAGDNSGRNLKTIIECNEDKPIQSPICNSKTRSVAFDAVSHVSSDDPEFEQIELVVDERRTKSGSGASSYKKPPSGNFGSFASSTSGKEMALQSLRPMPLELILELPQDISVCLTESYLMTRDIVANIGNLPKPLPIIGNYGRSSFVENDNWIM